METNFQEFMALQAKEAAARNESEPMEVDNEILLNDDDEVQVIGVEKKAIEILDDDDDDDDVDNDNANNNNKPKGQEEPAEEIEKRKRRRRLKRILKSDTPSFIAIIAPESEDDEERDGQSESYKPKKIKIDVNQYLGLKKNKPKTQTPDAEDTLHLYKKASTLPQDEGYFEGIVSMTLKDDIKYLNELHVLIRNQLELFSATDEDVQTQQAGRRYPTVRGKVGVRCIHCARVVLPKPPKDRVWPSGAVSYPLNSGGVYSVCTQKPALHFRACPNISDEIKAQIYRLTHDSHGNSNRRTTFNNTLGGSNAMTATTYYSVSLKRLGLVDVSGGMRFGRDLKLEPLPVESVRAQVESALGVKRTGISSKGTTDYQRVKADQESEKILAAALSEPDSSTIVGRSDDSKLVTDFMFLCVRQMAYCHCCPADFMTKGKKTPMMRVGLAGFCCRHCQHESNPEVTGQVLDFSCRSFSSAADNLASAVSNSFYTHLQRCYHAPPALVKALNAFKRTHKGQIAKLPVGSQRRLLQAIWNRLRSNDLTEEEMMERVENNAKNPPPPPSRAHPPLVVSSAPIVPDPAPSSSGRKFDEDGEWKSCYPPCDDLGTVRILKEAEDERDYSKNDGLITWEDRPITSDYVFFLMKQMKTAIPGPMDFTKGRRITALNTKQAGFCCRHCDGKQGSGRSFPSAPDNMASSLNSSLFQHMERCEYCPQPIKVALKNLKGLHSQQISNMRFGSQRKYFARLHERLKKVEVPLFEIPASKNKIKSDKTSGRRRAQGACARIDNGFIFQCGFVAINDFVYHCRHCRMVPLSLRARNSVVTDSPTRTYLEAHAKECKGDTFYLGNAVAALTKILAAHPAMTHDCLLGDEYDELIRAVVGDDNELVHVFTEVMMENMRTEVGTTSTRSSKKEDTNATSGYWKKYNLSPDYHRVSEAYARFAASIDMPETDLRKNVDLVWFFQMISPGFEMPPQTMGGRASRSK